MNKLLVSLLISLFGLCINYFIAGFLFENYSVIAFLTFTFAEILVNKIIIRTKEKLNIYGRDE